MANMEVLRYLVFCVDDDLKMCTVLVWAIYGRGMKDDDVIVIYLKWCKKEDKFFMDFY